MPELRFRVRWPDGATESCYSPSSVIADHLDAGTPYPLAQFLEISRLALAEASERVRQKYGFPCSRAMGQLARIEATAATYANQPDATVVVEGFEI